MKNILFLFLFVASFAFSQEDVGVDQSNPNETIYTHLYFLQQDSYEPAKAATTIYDLPQDEAIKKAIRIKAVLDGKGLLVDFDKIYQ